MGHVDNHLVLICLLVYHYASINGLGIFQRERGKGKKKRRVEAQLDNCYCIVVTTEFDEFKSYPSYFYLSGPMSFAVVPSSRKN